MKNAINQQKQKKISYAYYVVLGMLMLLIGIELFLNGSYFDELIGVVSILYLSFFSKKLERRDIVTLVILVLVILIGIISNLVSNLVSSAFSIGVDIVSETKLIFGFLFVKYLLNDNEKQRIIDALTPIAKLFTITSFIFGILSQFVNIGMTNGVRYGFKSFQFIFDFNHQYFAVYILIFGVLVCTSRLSERQRKRYYALALISILLSTKAPALIFTPTFIGLSIHLARHEKIKPWVYVIGAVAIFYLSSYQINEYLLNDTAPRKLFYEYGAKTANNYFPLGSGFSSFGSAEAQKNYSVLYYQYGFDKMFGMSPDDGSFLNDTFWATSIGQFGWVGAILYFIVYVRIFLTLDNTDFNNERRAYIYGAYLQYLVHAIGSAILSSSAGMIGFITLAIFTVSKPDDKLRTRKLKINF